MDMRAQSDRLASMDSDGVKAANVGQPAKTHQKLLKRAKFGLLGQSLVLRGKFAHRAQTLGIAPKFWLVGPNSVRAGQMSGLCGPGLAISSPDGDN